MVSVEVVAINAAAEAEAMGDTVIVATSEMQNGVVNVLNHALLNRVAMMLRIMMSRSLKSTVMTMWMI